jgi:hypothetical protein
VIVVVSGITPNIAILGLLRSRFQVLGGRNTEDKAVRLFVNNVKQAYPPKPLPCVGFLNGRRFDGFVHFGGEQSPARACILPSNEEGDMPPAKRLGIVLVDHADYKVFIDFSDGTFASFTADELAKLRPNRGLSGDRDSDEDLS